MKIRIPRTTLLTGLKTVVPAMQSKSSQAILQHCMFKAAPDASILELSANNSELGISIVLPCDVFDAGATTLPGRLLLEIATTLPDGDVDIESNDTHHSLITCEGVEMRVPGFSDKDFPFLRIPTKGAAAFELPGPTLKDVFARTLFCASSDTSRAVLTGILFQLEDGKLTAASTDLHRLSVVEMDSVKGKVTTILPDYTARHILRTLDGDVPVNAQVSEKGCRFAYGSITLSSRVIDGNFPHWKRVMPEETSESLVVPVKSLYQAVQRTRLFESGDFKWVKFLLSPGKLLVSGRHNHTGEAKTVVPVEFQSEHDVMFNSQYVLDCLTSLQQDTVTFEFNVGSYTYPWIAHEGNYRHLLSPADPNA